MVKTDIHKVKSYFGTGDSSLQRFKAYEHQDDSLAYYLLSRMNPLAENSKICDLGCGDGVMINLISRIRPDLGFHGIDLVEANVAKARELNPGHSFQVGNILEGIPFETGFDRIISSGVMEYLDPDDVVALNRTLVAHLNPGGVIVHCNIPDARKKIVYAMNRRLNGLKPLWGIPVGLLQFTLKTLWSPYFHKPDGGLWHNPERLNKELGTLGGVEIERRQPFYYFSFDLTIRPG